MWEEWFISNRTRAQCKLYGYSLWNSKTRIKANRFVAVFAQEVTEGASVGGSDQSGPAGGAGEKAPSGAARTTGFPRTAAARIHNWWECTQTCKLAAPSDSNCLNCTTNCNFKFVSRFWKTDSRFCFLFVHLKAGSFFSFHPSFVPKSSSNTNVTYVTFSPGDVTTHASSSATSAASQQEVNSSRREVICVDSGSTGISEDDSKANIPASVSPQHTHKTGKRHRQRKAKKKVMPSVLDQLKPAAQFSLNKSFYSYCQRTSLEIRCFSKQTEKKLTETRCLSGSNVPFLCVMTEESLLSCVIARCCCFTFQVNTWGFFQSAYFLFSL